MLHLGIIVATLINMLSTRESFLKCFLQIKYTQLILPKWENVRIFPNILWATINCSFGFMKNGFDVI